MVMQSPARHETPKKMTMTVAKSAKRQKVMEACLRKVKANRHSLVSSMRAGGLTPASFRSEIGKLVNYEWSTMENGAGVAPNSAMHVVDPDYQGLRQEELEEAEYAETIIALEQAFLEDIRREEQSLVDQYFEEVRRFEEEQIQDAIDRYVPEEEGEEAVWCPICRRGQLKQSHRIIFCSHQPCGLRLDTKQDEVNLSYVRHRLGETITQHSQRCGAGPGFALRQEPLSGTVMLCMACEACNTLDVVL